MNAVNIIQEEPLKFIDSLATKVDPQMDESLLENRLTHAHSMKLLYLCMIRCRHNFLVNRRGS